MKQIITIQHTQSSQTTESGKRIVRRFGDLSFLN